MPGIAGAHHGTGCTQLMAVATGQALDAHPAPAGAHPVRNTVV
ncbi:hypothetical protein ACFY1P_33285 [Streptomyces sp. NPDC001407]